MSGLMLLIVSMNVSLVRVSLGGNLGTMSFDNPTHLHSPPTNRGVSRLQSLRFPSTLLCHETMVQAYSVKISSWLATLLSETEDPGGRQSMGSWRVRHDWSAKRAHTLKVNNICRPVFPTVLITTALWNDISKLSSVYASVSFTLWETTLKHCSSSKAVDELESKEIMLSSTIKAAAVQSHEDPG